MNESPFNTVRQFIFSCKRSSDFTVQTVTSTRPNLKLSYYKTLIDEQQLQRHLMLGFDAERSDVQLDSLEALHRHLPIDGIRITDDLETIRDQVLFLSACGPHA